MFYALLTNCESALIHNSAVKSPMSGAPKVTPIGSLFPYR